MQISYSYIIAGAGLAGTSAIEGIREYDKRGSILLLGKEKYLPYERPPLTKSLWFGKKKVEKIFVHTQEFYEQNSVEFILDNEVSSVDVQQKIITDSKGRKHKYGKLLLTTGGVPRRLPIPGGDLEGIYYYRYLDDYFELKRQTQEGKTATIIGGGFIGSEIAAVLNINKLKVTMIFPDAYLLERVFPSYLGNALEESYKTKGVEILSKERPAAITKREDKFVIKTESGKQIESDILVAGIGIAPETALAKAAGLNTANGIEVNSRLQTSNPDVYAAGDNAIFPCKALNEKIRVEHWDNAINQGKYAGRNMTGANEPYDYLPFFFSDLFEFSYEAVGEINPQLETFADWQEENRTGVIYFLKESKVRGVMMCNVWEKVDEARQLIMKAEQVVPENLRGAISFE